MLLFIPFNTLGEIQLYTFALQTTIMSSIPFKEAKNYLQRIALSNAPSSVKISSLTPSISLIKLSHPARMNSLSVNMMLDFSNIIDTLEQSQLGNLEGVILTGEQHFCAGYDVSSGLSSEGGKMMSIFMQNILDRFLNLPIISVAALEGYALGGGAELSTCCDYRVVSKNVAWQMVHRKMGVTQGYGGIRRLLPLIGRSNTLRLIGTGERIGSAEGLKLGLFDLEVSGQKSVVDASVEFLQRFTDKKEWTPLSSVKKAFVASVDSQKEKCHADIAEIFSKEFGSERNLAAIKALSDKRNRSKL
jgi:ethylmalonyl-CoA/methylmalonyl-CoA decarboxylase